MRCEQPLYARQHLPTTEQFAEQLETIYRANRIRRAAYVVGLAKTLTLRDIQASKQHKTATEFTVEYFRIFGRTCSLRSYETSWYN